MLTLRPIEGSSTIVAIGHDSESVYVLFRSQKVYRYVGVPVTVKDEFLAAPSKGQYLNASIKPHYQASVYDGPYAVRTSLSLRELLPGPSYGF